MTEKKSRNIKKRNWAFVLYPESAPEDWREQLQQTGLPCVVSPLHDKDLDPTGQPKKPHYHVILVYSGPTAYSVVSALTSSLNQPIPKALESVKGYYRYLTHKDNPDKAQYSELEITTINGFDISDFAELTRSEVNDIIRRTQQLCRDMDIVEYSDLLDYLLDNENFAEHDVVASHTLLFNSYLRSRRFKSLHITESEED